MSVAGVDNTPLPLMHFVVDLVDSIVEVFHNSKTTTSKVILGATHNVTHNIVQGLQ